MIVLKHDESDDHWSGSFLYVFGKKGFKMVGLEVASRINVLIGQFYVRSNVTFVCLFREYSQR